VLGRRELNLIDPVPVHDRYATLALSCSQFCQHRYGNHEARKRRRQEEGTLDLSKVIQDRRIDDAEKLQGSILREGTARP
jgi:hypothetical protein